MSDSARGRLDGEGERIPQSKRPDRAIFALGVHEERIIGRDRAVGVDPQQLPLERVHPLRGPADGLLAEGDIELAVLAEMQRPALVAEGILSAERRLVVAFEQDDLAAGVATSPGREPADPWWG